MRLALAAIIAAAGASAASAEVVQDRYGPPRKSDPMALAALERGAYGGPLLGWSGKTAPRVEAPAPAPLVRQVPAPPVQAPQVHAPQAAAPVIPSPHYAPRPAPPAAYRPAPQAAALQPPAPPPRSRPVLAGGPPETAPPPAASPRPGAAPRYYSLHREYGRAPDAIPPQAMAPRYVLIGPPDSPSAPADQDNGESSKSSGQF